MKFKNISSINLKNFREIKISEVKKISSEGRKVYNSLEEALKNKLNLYPGPKLISQEIVKLGLAKPFYLKQEKNYYILMSAQARFWAYQLAYKNRKTIPSIILK